MTALDPWPVLLADYTTTALRRGLLSSTVAMHCEKVRNLARTVATDPAAVTPAAFTGWLDNPRWGRHTRKASRAAAAAVFGWAYKSGRLPADPTAGVYASRLRPPPPSPSAPTPTPGDWSGTEHPARVWARHEGIPVAPTGHLPGDVVARWVAAGQPLPDGQGLDDPDPVRAWAALCDRYEVHARAAGLSIKSIALRRQACRAFARATRLTPQATTRPALITYLANEAWRPETRRSRRTSLGVVLRWAVEEGHLDHDPTARLPRVHVPHGVPRPAPETVIRDAVNGASPKVRMMLMLGALAGLRRGEIATLRVEDITGEGLHITGKGGRQRLIPVHPSLADELAAYLTTQHITRGWVFPGAEDGHLSIDWVGRAISQRMPDGWSAHKLRHRFASRAYSGAYDLRSVQQLLGHSSPTVTAIYIAVPSTSLIAAVRAVPPVPGIEKPAGERAPSTSD